MKTYLKRNCMALLLLTSVVGVVHAKTATICNMSPLKMDVSIAYGNNKAEQSIGWYQHSPGECRTWKVYGNKFYYYAMSGEKLARWLNDGQNVQWDGWSFICADPVKAFYFQSMGACSKKLGFKPARLSGDSISINIYEKNHKGVELGLLNEIRRQLTGVMDYEQMLVSSPGREAPFQLGIKGEDEDGLGVRITHIYPGMAAELEGLNVNDVITSVDGYKVESVRELAIVLDRISLFREGALPLTIIRDLSFIEGQISPIFFPFNHVEYESNKKAGTFMWTMLNGAALGFGNELLCGGANLLKGGIEAMPEDQDFDGKRVLRDAEKCSDGLNTNLSKREILYAGSATAGYWASLLMPGIPIAKAARLGRSVPLAMRSRHVARGALSKTFSKKR